jgi:hypothetical protein
MTSSKPSDSESLKSSELPLSATADGVCEKCSGPTRLRNARPYPVVLQILFGVSFAVFLWVQSSTKVAPKVLWAWSIFQVTVGILLVRARYASAKKVFICLRCGATLG